ncbi:MAG: MBOAT family O-acyltransferase [Flavobacterium nitrogenifigens]|uniref:D-alanyl-lipoteichoic acid acyltransferase DltB, MBOAT superfamily n=1 Tax=Flavobacterium nitrogenifigens TaxID=1617283 RepID=A0A521EDX6_9FLAO|nr:MBOAT family O-acyltransferase [Flavobacterium nitrogenifigens]KAF2325948.1 MBOAT family protein [Flavobacterium nitrogenifigens]MDQ8013039.1 MBOAT family O-acyltransferase [Flavobacterium nitrogenifigens]SMO82127.1 D-alanyl-lipoteichoic acid acyltransferase DltB, MBOAT superfamily [Flavobacterium nitrogenifigens]
MLFNSLTFALFLPVVFIFYWSVNKKSLKIQNILLLGSSYFFYSCWDWRFLFLLIFSTLLDFFSGIQIEKAKSQYQKKFWFWLSIIVNLGFLGIFKYFNFFAESLKDLISIFGFQVNIWSLQVILPIGISFYTFHGLSYVIDIYKNRIKAEKNFIDYALFVSYFPLLVAGPIERATHLLPQIKKKRNFNYEQAVDGLRQILWGLFKKIVIADNCAIQANLIFNNSTEYSGSTLAIGAIFFAFQIYGDFSGYSDIALGVSRLFGIELLQNFSFPYFSRDIAEFWRRWHISLSSWFKDYLYIPLGGSKGGRWGQVRNTFAVFLVSGFWHGANWTFIIWGLLNAIYFLPLLLLNKNRSHIEIVALESKLPSIKEFVMMVTTFTFTVLAWIFFRAKNVKHALQFISGIFSKSFFSLPTERPTYLILLILLFIVIEWLGRRNKYALEKLEFQYNTFFRWSMYMIIIVFVFIFGAREQEFIYFQF